MYFTVLNHITNYLQFAQLELSRMMFFCEDFSNADKKLLSKPFKTVLNDMLPQRQKVFNYFEAI